MCGNRFALILMTASLATGGSMAAAGQRDRTATAPATTEATRERGLDDRTQQIVALQTALDRAGFSPGEIDGATGRNTDEALRAYRAANGGDPMPRAPITYAVTSEDVAGPFVTIPEEMMAKAALTSLGYVSSLELLGERFHVSPRLLQRLNPGAAFAAGESIVVPDVEPFLVPPPSARGAGDAAAARAAAAAKPAVIVTVTDRTKSLEVRGGDGRIVMHAPVTVGSENDPLPVGEWTVRGVSVNPPFHYNPKLFWDANPTDAKTTIAPGPNNPVGVVWIDLSKPHYGIHGTPEPGRIGHTESHGCIRLTNWDAMRLEGLVKPGTKVVLE
jgi:lipoprotein-anchoring transpeptidase ErfK/SrfK